MIAGQNAETRSHPDASRDVWEIAVWDPIPVCLRIFCLFSPGHVLVYWLFLPTGRSDPRPSITVVTTIFFAALLSAQLLLLQSSFSQQSKDSSVIHKEVMNEYDTKYVHPRTQPLMRDVGTQFSDTESSPTGLPLFENEGSSVDVYAPTFIINRGFQTRPNPNYTKHVDPEGSTSRPGPLRELSTPQLIQTPAHLRDTSSPLRPQTAIRQPHFRASGAGDGGSLGVFSHANSPLRNSSSSHLMRPHGQGERSLSPQKREGSPLKRSSFAPSSNMQRLSHLQGPASRRESGRF